MIRNILSGDPEAATAINAWPGRWLRAFMLKGRP